MENSIALDIEFPEPEAKHAKIVFPDADVYYQVDFVDLETRTQWLDDISRVSTKYFVNNKLSLRSVAS